MSEKTNTPKEPKAKKEPRSLKVWEAILVFGISVLFIGYAALSRQFPIGMGIFLALIFCIGYAMIVQHFGWDELFEEISGTIHSVLFGLLFCLSVGFVSAAWLASGTIPFMLYWGLNLINPDIFLLVAFVICGIAAFATGQAWTMIPSLGIAFMGIATALNIPPAMAAAAIVSGCFLGDAASPVCEVPAIATISAGSDDVMGTIKSMIPTKGVGILVGCVAYFLLGMTFNVEAADVDAAAELMTAAEQSFNLSPLTLLPLVLVFVLVFMKFPMLPAVTIGALVGVLEAVVLQGMEFNSVINMMWSGYKCNTGFEILDSLLTRGGIMDFAGTIVMLLFAFSFAGVIKKMGMMKAIMTNVLKIVRNPGMLVLITTITDLFGVMLTGSANVSSLINGEVYKDAYKKMGVAPVTLARTMAMDGAVFNAMLPWSASGALCFSALGVSNFEYWPYMIPFWVALVLNIFFAFIGKFTPMLEAQETEAAAAAE